MVVTEGAGSDQAIGCLPTAVTAFIGRALRGPVNRPVALGSYADYQQVFGGLWQPSTLSYAVEQFFENGGREAVVVRVVNGGALATITLPCGDESLTLEALSPGSREVLRASVDYDNIGPAEEDRFNLVVQRVRAIGSEHIEDQEIFRRISITPGSARFVASALQESMLVRVRGAAPATRPDRTFRPGARHPIGYVDSNPDGDDGAPLTDYDLIGSPDRGTGLFALRGLEALHFLCIPPPARDRDVGPSVLLAASQFCRERRLMLIVDPPAAWDSCDDALHGLREMSFSSDHALMAFPRVLAYDRLRGRHEVFAQQRRRRGRAGADGRAPSAVARGRRRGSPAAAEHSGPRVMLTDAERNRLVSHGINPLQSLRAADPRGVSLKTLAGGSGSSPDSMLLTARRRQLLIVNSIETGTRWARFEGREPQHLGATRAAGAIVPAAAGCVGPVRRRRRRPVHGRLRRAAAQRRGSRGRARERAGVAQDAAARRVPVVHDLAPARRHARVRPVRSNRLAAGAQMTVHGTGSRSRCPSSETHPRRTLAQHLFGQHREPRPGSTSTLARFGQAEAAAAGRLDLDLVGYKGVEFRPSRARSLSARRRESRD